MRNMKAICIKLTCFLLVLSMSSAAMAESITSPNGQLQAMYSAITTTYRLRSVMNTISMNTTILTDRKQTFLIRAIRN